MSAPAPEVLDVPAVMELYLLRDRRSARKLMDEAGAFEVGGRLLVRREDLLAHEEALRRRRREAGAAEAKQPPTARSRRRGGRAPEASRPRGPLPADWWRPPESDAA